MNASVNEDGYTMIRWLRLLQHAMCLMVLVLVVPQITMAMAHSSSQVPLTVLHMTTIQTQPSATAIADHHRVACVPNCHASDQQSCHHHACLYCCPINTSASPAQLIQTPQKVGPLSTIKWLSWYFSPDTPPPK